MATDSTGCHLLPPYRCSRPPPCATASCAPASSPTPMPWAGCSARGSLQPPPAALSGPSRPSQPREGLQDRTAAPGTANVGLRGAAVSPAPRCSGAALGWVRLRASTKEGAREGLRVHTHRWRPLPRVPWINTALCLPVLPPTGEREGQRAPGSHLASPPPASLSVPAAWISPAEAVLPVDSGCSPLGLTQGYQARPHS